MILCVDTKALKVDFLKVQKDVKIEEILNKHTAYFNDENEAIEAGYMPLDFCVSIRSMRDNTVVEIDNTALNKDNDEKGLVVRNYYVTLSNVPELIHKGYDLVMYMSSIGVMHCIDYKQGFEELMTKHSVFECIGLYNPDPKTIRPKIYSQVIMSDEGMKELEQYLKDGVQIIHIKDVIKKWNFSAFLDTLVLVQEEKENE